jgi:hypothetical protein
MKLQLTVLNSGLCNLTVSRDKDMKFVVLLYQLLLKYLICLNLEILFCGL